MDERIEFVIKANAGNGNLSELCREYGISRPTGYLWLKRFGQLGSISELNELSRQPINSPRKTAEIIEREVVKLKTNRPCWGARKLKVELDKQNIHLSERTVHRVLKRHDLVRERKQYSNAKLRFERDLPNQLWQMDFKGEYRKSKSLVYPLTLLDDHSRYLIGLTPLTNTQTSTVEACLVDTFKKFGLPDAILTDHGSPWWSTHSEHGLTRLSVGLINQGIKLYYSGVGHPQTQGKVERFHRTLNEEILCRGIPHSLKAWTKLLDKIRYEYNEERPHEALKLKPPNTRYKPSEKSYQVKPKAWEYPVGSTVLKVDSSGAIRFKTRQYFTSHALIGENVQVEAIGEKLLITYRHMTVRKIDVKTGKGRPLILPRKV